MSTPLLVAESITKRFPGVIALDAVSLDIEAGEFHAIVGENGAGKSTLMKILSGVITPDEGQLLLRGEPVAFGSTRDAEAAGISIIHQELNLVNELSASANIFLGREPTGRFGGLDEAVMRAETRRLLAELECDIPPETLVGSLRVGDQQLIEIAKALSLDAEVLIMDEPTSALNETEVERLFRVIERLLAVGKTILYISHKMNEVFRRSDRITVLRDGQLVTTADRTATNPTEIAHRMVGREIEAVTLGEHRVPGEVRLRVENLHRTGHPRDGSGRLVGLDFEVRSGEVVGFAGLMGAGRTELLECLFGEAPVSEGRILLDGEELRFAHPAEAMATGIALVPEDRKRLGLLAHLSVRENITLCTLDDLLTAGLLLPGPERKAARESIADLSIRTAGTENRITSLSGGNQQKCIIARWLRTGPRVLLLDDPTRGIDVGAKAELYRIIDRLASEGMAIIVTSSELPELMTLSDRILVLHEGRLTAEFDREAFSEETLMEAATGGGVVTPS